MIKVNASLGRCDLSIVGLGWGGIYAAWRLAIDAPPEKRIDPRTICLFEVSLADGGISKDAQKERKSANIAGT
jgi:hypothetical protein